MGEAYIALAFNVSCSAQGWVGLRTFASDIIKVTYTMYHIYKIKKSVVTHVLHRMCLQRQGDVSKAVSKAVKGPERLGSKTKWLSHFECLYTLETMLYTNCSNLGLKGI